MYFLQNHKKNNASNSKLRVKIEQKENLIQMKKEVIMGLCLEKILQKKIVKSMLIF